MEEKIVAMLIENPHLTRKDLAKRLGVTEISIRYRLDKMKESGRIERVGSTKAGKWVVWR